MAKEQAFAANSPSSSAPSIFKNWGKMIGANLLTILVFLALINTPLAQNSAMVCKKEGVEIFAPKETKSVEICCDGICASRDYKAPFLMQIPDENLIIGFKCEGTYWESLNQSKSLETVCPPINFCELIECSFCWELILNPSCYPNWAAFLIGGIFIILLIKILVIWCLLYFLCRCCRRRQARCLSWCGGRRLRSVAQRSNRRRKKQPISSESDENDNFLPKFKQSAKRNGLTKLGLALAILCIFFPITHGSIDIISLTASTEECEVGEENSTCSYNWVTQLTMLPAGQLVQQILKDPQGNFAGTLSMRLNGITQKCLPETLGWLRSYKIETAYRKRCPGKGTCTGNRCKDLLPNGTIPDIEEGQGMLGNAFCIESTGFLYHKCLSPLSSCLLYRNYVVPTSKTVFEYFHCPFWDYFITTEIFLEIPGRDIIKEKIQLFSGYTHHWAPANLSLTPAIMGRPAMPAMGSKFISDYDRAALVPELPRDLECPTEVDAQHILTNCKLSLAACPYCRPDHDEGSMRCHCRELNLEEYINDPRAKLPQPQGSLTMHYEEGEILAKTPYIPVLMTARMEGMRLITQNIKANCSIEPLSLVGCYKCPTGGLFSFKCTSTYGNPTAEVQCGENVAFGAHCSTNGTFDHAILKFPSADVQTRCLVKCRAGTTEFELKGKLNYIVKRQKDLGISGAASNPLADEDDGFLSNLIWKFVGNVLGFSNFYTIGIAILIAIAGIFALIIFIKLNPIFRMYRALSRIIVILAITNTVNGEVTEDKWEIEPINFLLLGLALFLLANAAAIYFDLFGWLKMEINQRKRANRLARNTQLIM